MVVNSTPLHVENSPLKSPLVSLQPVGIFNKFSYLFSYILLLHLKCPTEQSGTKYYCITIRIVFLSDAFASYMQEGAPVQELMYSCHCTSQVNILDHQKSIFSLDQQTSSFESQALRVNLSN